MNWLPRPSLASPYPDDITVSATWRTYSDFKWQMQMAAVSVAAKKLLCLVRLTVKITMMNIFNFFFFIKQDAHRQINDDSHVACIDHKPN